MTNPATSPATLPWFAFYVDRFVKETSLLNPIEVAVYYRFLESYAQNGYLPDDLYILEEVARLDSALGVFRALIAGKKPDRDIWEGIKEAAVTKLLKLFFNLRDDGNYHHTGWDTELEKSQQKHSASVRRAALMNEKLGRGAGAVADMANAGEAESGLPESPIQ
jgi:uncharacterized protein YdaU (DUF1376 family)